MHQGQALLKAFISFSFLCGFCLSRRVADTAEEDFIQIKKSWVTRRLVTRVWDLLLHFGIAEAGGSKFKRAPTHRTNGGRKQKLLQPRVCIQNCTHTHTHTRSSSSSPCRVSVADSCALHAFQGQGQPCMQLRSAVETPPCVSFIRVTFCTVDDLQKRCACSRLFQPSVSRKQTPAALQSPSPSFQSILPNQPPAHQCRHP